MVMPRLHAFVISSYGYGAGSAACDGVARLSGDQGG